MNAEALLGFYKELYFHELDARDKLTARLKLLFGALTALGGLLGYLLVRLEPVSSFVLAMMIVFYPILAVLVPMAAWYFVRSLWNHSYECLPVATELEGYRQELIATYSEYSDGSTDVEKYFNDALARYFRECSSANALVNQTRSFYMHVSMSFVVYTIPAVLVLGLCFLFARQAN